MKVRIHIPWHIIWIMGLLEAITVPLLIFLHQPTQSIMQAKSIPHGFVIGLIGTAIVFIALRIFLPKLKIQFQQQTILYFYPLISISLWGGLLLAILFWLENLTMPLFSSFSIILSNVFVAFVATFFTLLFIALLYRLSPIGQIKIACERERYVIQSFSIFSIAFLAALYEVIALPLIWQLFAFTQQPLISGLIGGVAGSAVVYLYHRFVKLGQIYIMLDNPKLN